MNVVVVDTNAAVDYLREDRLTPPALLDTENVILPLPVLGELYGGAAASARKAENVAAVERLVANCTVLIPDLETARVYGHLRAVDASASIGVRRRNDLWIAALCVQHGLPLVTNDHAFKAIPGLTIITW